MSWPILRAWHLAIVVVLMVCLFRMPYWYYDIVTIVSTFSFAVFAVFSFSRHGWLSFNTLFYIASAIVFNPFRRPYLGRVGWNLVDIIVSIVLIAIVVVESRTLTSNRKVGK